MTTRWRTKHCWPTEAMNTRISQIRFWRRIFLAIVFVQSVLVASLQHNELSTHFSGIMFYAFCGIAVVLSPFMILWVIGIQILNPMSDPQWELPSSDGNPLRLGNPLNFAHFAAQLGLTSGVGYLLASSWCGFHTFVLAVTCVLVGLGWFLGLRWSIRIAGNKITPASSRPTPQCRRAESPSA